MDFARDTVLVPLHPATLVGRRDPGRLGDAAVEVEPIRKTIGLRIRRRPNDSSGEPTLLLGPSVEVGAGLQRVTVRSRGAGRGGLVFVIVDAESQFHSFDLPAAAHGPHELSLAHRKRASWGGRADGTIRYPIRQVGFVLRAEGFSGSIEILWIRFETPRAAVDRRIRRAAFRLRRQGDALGRLSPGHSGLEDRWSRDRRTLSSLHQSLGRRALTEASAFRALALLEERQRRLDLWLTSCPAVGAPAPRAVLVDGVAVEPAWCRNEPWRAETRSPEQRAPELLVETWAVRGGHVSLRLSLLALEDVAAVEPRLGPLRAEGFDADANAVEFAWHPVLEAEVEVDSGAKTSLPDPLGPAAPLAVKADRRLALFATLTVDAKTRPGDYRGVLFLAVEGRPLPVLRLRLRISEARLPRRRELRTLVGLDVAAVARFYGRRALGPEDSKTWIDFLARRGIHGDPLVGSCHWWHPPDRPLGPGPRDVLRQQGERFGLVWLGRASNRWWSLDETDRRRVERDWLADLRRRFADFRRWGLGHRAHLYVYDEPGREHYAALRPFLAACREAAPGAKIVLVFYRDDPRELAPHVDVWCPHIAWLHRHADRLESLRRLGGETWLYLTDDAPPLPSLRLEAPAVHARVLAWLVFRYGFDGLLHWDSCHWHRNIDRRPRWPASPWSANERQGGRRLGSGNGSLLYPGPDGKPLSSLRLEALRRGIEDHALLTRLRDRVGRSGSRDAARLLDVSDLVRSPTDFETDPRAYDRRIFEVVERLRRHPSPHIRR